MCNLVYIEYDGRIWVFDNKNGEDTDMFYDRCWFIIQHRERKNAKELANLYINKKYLGVSYNHDIEALLTESTSLGNSELQ